MTALIHSELEGIRERLRAYLSRREVHHGMLLSLLDRSSDEPLGRRRSLVVAYHNEDVVGVALSHVVPPFALIASEMPTDAARAVAEVLAAGDAELAKLAGPPAAAEALALEWSRLTGKRAVRDLEMRLLALESVVRPESPAGRAAVARTEHRDLVRRWCDAFQADVGEPPMPDERLRTLFEAGSIQLWFDAAGTPSSMAGIVRETPNAVAIALVYTPEQLRRRGHATACVAALCERVLGAGKRWCVLYADVEDPAANRVYDRVGFREVGASWRYRFHE